MDQKDNQRRGLMVELEYSDTESQGMGIKDQGVQDDEYPENEEFELNMEALIQRSIKEKQKGKKPEESKNIISFIDRKKDDANLKTSKNSPGSSQSLTKTVSQKFGQNFLDKYEFMTRRDSKKEEEVDAKKFQSVWENNDEIHNNSRREANWIIDQNLIKAQNVTVINKIPVYFPYKAYVLQIEYMKSAIEALQDSKNALLESPTGTGKTLCLLCSVLSWVEDRYKKTANSQKTKVIYLSRTHSQLKQVQSELQKTCFRPTIANFGSRDQFCIKEEFSEIKGRDLMESCSKAVKLTLKAKRKLEIQDHEEVADPNSKTQKLACEYYRTQSEYLTLLERQGYENTIITSEMIKEEGIKNCFCPYYYPFQIKEKANLIFMPYNYILDASLMSRYSQIIKGSILIFDQAHNVSEAACEGRSFAITSNIFSNMQQETQKLVGNDYMSSQLKIVAYEYSAYREDIEKLSKRVQMKLDAKAEDISSKFVKKMFNDYESEKEEIIKPFDMKYLFYYLLSPRNLDEAKLIKLSTADLKAIHIETVTHISRIIKNTLEFIEALKQTYDGIFQQIQKFITFISKVIELLGYFDEYPCVDWESKEINHYRLSFKINEKEGERVYQVKLLCLTPSLTFGDLSRYEPRSMILTSGTMTPLDSWTKELKIPFDVQLVNKHVIEEEQLHLAIVSKGAYSQNMNFSFNEIKNRPKIFAQLVETVNRLADKIPHGILVIFPSYRIIKCFKDQLKNNFRTLNDLKSKKQLCFEDKGTTDYVIMSFKQMAMKKKGAILFCVCRGKVSEGLDFSDELCRAVVFVGVPFPNIKDPIIQEKKEYYDKLCREGKKNQIRSISGDEWYNLNTMRAVNQGLGRVIRHINDYGMIFLFDNRYEQGRMRSLLPKWALTNMKVYVKFSELEIKVQDFYKSMISKFGEKKESQEDDDHGFSSISRNQIKVQAQQNAFHIMMGKNKQKNKRKTKVDMNQKKYFL